MDKDTNVFGPVILEETDGTVIPVQPKMSDDSDTSIT